MADYVSKYASGQAVDAQLDKAEHGNRAVLDGVTSTKVAAWDDSAGKAHKHDNKSVLDGIGSADIENLIMLNYLVLPPNPNDPYLLPELGNVAKTPEILLSSQNISFTQSTQMVLQVSLASQPAGNVVVSLSSDKAFILLNKTTLTFSEGNYSTPQLVSISSSGVTGNQTGTITISAAGYEYQGLAKTVSVTVIDTNVPNLIVSKSSIQFNEGESQTFTVKLSSQPTANVTVNIASDNPDITLNKTSISFTTANYSAEQIVTVSSALDPAHFENKTGTISISASGGNYNSVSATIFVTVINIHTPNDINTTAFENMSDATVADFATSNAASNIQIVDGVVTCTPTGTYASLLYKGKNFSAIEFEVATSGGMWWMFGKKSNGAVIGMGDSSMGALAHIGTFDTGGGISMGSMPPMQTNIPISVTASKKIRMLNDGLAVKIWEFNSNWELKLHADLSVSTLNEITEFSIGVICQSNTTYAKMKNVKVKGE